MKPEEKAGKLLCMDKFRVTQQPSDPESKEDVGAATYRGELSQIALGKWRGRRILLDEIETPITALLARGAKVERGMLHAELRNSRDEVGNIVLRLVVEQRLPSDSQNQPALAPPCNSVDLKGTPAELRPAAKSSCTFQAEPSEKFPRDVDMLDCLNHSGELSQQALLEWSERRKMLDEIEKAITTVLARGAKVERGPDKAELRPCRDESGNLILRLLVRP